MRMVIALLCVMAGTARAQMWQDATADCTGTTAEWSNKLELADLDGDGQLDILVANGSGYSTKGPNPEPTRVWKNLGNWSGAAPHCTEVSSTTVLGFMGWARVIRAADVDGDGDLDIFTGGAYQTQAKLFLNNGGTWTDASAQLPQQLTSLGDAEFGDVDGDGDLDLVMVDWGVGDAENNAGGPTRLYLNDGTGHFTIAPMPDQLIEFSWDISLVDIDNDWDLDLLVSSKGATSFVFLNDGAGHFTLAPNALPHHANNYSLEPMDVDGDGYMDLATINDGVGGRNTLLMNKQDGTFADETSTRLTGTANPATDDNAAVFLDADNDGDADMLVASLSGPDRLLLNDGSGHFTLAAGSATPNDTPGSLGIAVGDLDGDGRLDIVQAQGEVAFPEKVQLATSAIAIDTQPPVVRVEQVFSGGTRVRARVHDHQSPSRIADWKSVVLKVNGSDIPMHWYGEYLWAADAQMPFGHYQVCATDRQNNTACADGDVAVPGDDTPPGDGAPHGDMPTTQPGGCCDTGSAAGSLYAPLLILFVSAKIRSRRRCSGTPRRDPRSA
jgi:FG-GAP-like repeat